MRRKLVSLLILLGFSVMSVSGILMYLRPFESNLSSIHTSFGFVFIAGAIIHLWNNIIPIKKYATDKSSNLMLSKSFIILSILVVSLSYLSFTGKYGFSIIYDIGNEYRNAQLGKQLSSKNVEYIALSRTVGNYNLDIEGKLGASFQYPMLAVWIEDEKGNYLQSVYVSESIGTSVFDFKKRC